MPYKSKAEQESERWMTLPETLAHICSVENCGEKAAQREAVKALADGVRVLGPLKWERERADRQPPFGTTSITAPTDTPPLGAAWLEAKIRWKTGRVRDDWGEYKPGKWRLLLILRSKVVNLWRLSPASISATVGNTKGTNVAPFTHRKKGPKTAKGDSIVGAITEDIKAGRLTIEDLRSMPDKELVAKYGKNFGAKRTACREARERVLTEFDGNSNSVK
jgi:hypothetical protein